MKLGDPQLLKSALESLPGDQQLRYQAQGQPAPQAYPPTDRMTKHQVALSLMQNAQFSFKTIQEAECLASLLANCFPEPDRVVKGLAELMFNAVEHGNLGIGYQMKAELCSQGNWTSEIQHRLENPVFKCRSAEATVARKDGGIYIVVSDQGEGFDWKNYMKIDPARAGETHGRGIAMANSISFDKLTYNEKGNKAVAFVADQSSLNW